MSYQRFRSHCFSLSLLIVFSSSFAFAEAPDYLKMTELLTLLDSKPELFADAAKNRIAFCAAKENVASETDVRRNGAMSDTDQLSAIKWVTEFSMEQALFAKDDMESLLKQIGEMPEADAQAWYRNSVNVRVIAETPEWKVTNQWLNEFWTVQAMYKDAQILDFQKKLKKLTPIGVSVVMDHMVSVLEKRVQRQQAAVTRRQSYRYANSTSGANRRSTSGTPAGYYPQQPPASRRAPRQRIGDSFSQQITRPYVFRGPLFNFSNN